MKTICNICCYITSIILKNKASYLEQSPHNPINGDHPATSVNIKERRIEEEDEEEREDY